MAPLILLAVSALGGIGLQKGVSGIKKRNLAIEIQSDTKDALKNAEKMTESYRRETSEKVQKLGKIKLEIMATEIQEFVKYFSRIKSTELKETDILSQLNIKNFSVESIKELEQATLNAQDILKEGATGIAAGVLLAYGTYGGIMTFGTASTGTLISGLSGIAAKNATLAFLGGGSIASGGGGIALGQIVLGGLVVGPALLIVGSIFDAKADTMLNTAKSNRALSNKMIEELYTANVQILTIGEVIDLTQRTLLILNRFFKKSIYEMKKIIKKEVIWEKMTFDDKKSIAETIKFAQIIKKIIDTPILDSNGGITKEVFELNKNIKKELTK